MSAPTGAMPTGAMPLSERFRGISVRIGALIFAAFLFAAAFPNPVFTDGLPFVGWFAFFPVFWVCSGSSVVANIFYGAFYGYLSYGLYGYWLSVFHPLAGVIVSLIFLTWFALFFPLFGLAVRLFPRKGYIVQWLLWLAYEFLRTRGFAGFSYGVAGYSQWSVAPILQTASVFGVWGVNALVVLPSAYLGAAVGAAPLLPSRASILAFLRNNRVVPALWAAAMMFSVFFGLASPVDYSAAPVKRLALIQHNTDPWRGGIEAYRENFYTLTRLSDEALAAEPKPDMVVWSETAFVPRIYWHTTYRDDPESYALVKELLDYLKTKDVPFVIGNDDGRKEPGPSGEWERVDYNAVLLFEKGEEVQAYRKLHLVPFTEHFPYEKQFPFIYEALKNADTHFWKKGTEPVVFDAAGFRFSTPICFEDTFGYLSRLFVREGAQVIVNLTNDAWAKSLPAQMQHMTMAIFRAVENRRTVVRSSASGQTCAIDPNGAILAMAEPFAERWLTVEIPIFTDASTVYTAWGDVPAFLMVAIAAVVFGVGLVRSLVRRKRD